MGVDFVCRKIPPAIMTTFFYPSMFPQVRKDVHTEHSIYTNVSLGAPSGCDRPPTPGSLLKRCNFPSFPSKVQTTPAQVSRSSPVRLSPRCVRDTPPTPPSWEIGERCESASALGRGVCGVPPTTGDVRGVVCVVCG